MKSETFSGWNTCNWTKACFITIQMCACRAYLPFLASLYMFICILNSPLPPKDPISSEHFAPVTRMISLVPIEKPVNIWSNHLEFSWNSTIITKQHLQTAENPSSIFPSNFPILSKVSPWDFPGFSQILSSAGKTPGFSPMDPLPEVEEADFSRYSLEAAFRDFPWLSVARTFHVGNLRVKW